jgi:hypothetical protein
VRNFHRMQSFHVEWPAGGVAAFCQLASPSRV